MCDDFYKAFLQYRQPAGVKTALPVIPHWHTGDTVAVQGVMLSSSTECTPVAEACRRIADSPHSLLDFLGGVCCSHTVVCDGARQF